MSTRLAILLRRLDGWEFYMRGNRDTIPWCGHLLMTGYTEQRFEQYTQYFIALGTEVLLWFCERCAKNLYKRHRYSILSYESPSPPTTHHFSRPNLSALSSTNSYAGLNFSSFVPSALSAFNAGLGCVSVVPPNDVYPWSYN